MIWLLLACQQEAERPGAGASSASPSLAPASGAPAPQGFQPVPGSSASEDLSGAWKKDLAVPLLEDGAAGRDGKEKGGCSDEDGDGFPSAASCPWEPSITADCDDSDPDVTPETERWIPPGAFLMGSESDHAGSDEDPVHVVRLSGYCLDRDEASAAAWAEWLAEEGRTPAGSDVRNMQGGELEAGRGGHPAEGVTYGEAEDFCRAQGKSLPTEAQWEKAARGGCELGTEPDACDAADLRPYPWGSEEPTCSRANHQLSTSGMPKLCTSDTLPADALPGGDGPYGHRHLAGNVWEYVSDYWHPATYGGSRRDPGGPAGGEMHVLRGGGWNTFSTNMRAANRFHDLVMGSAAGFRCARSASAPVPDKAAPLELVALSGTVDGSKLGGLKGRALYISAFDAADADSSGMLAPGRSPVAELKLDPEDGTEQKFSIRVPKGGSYIISAALDAGTGAKKDGYVSASGSGGFGQAEGNPHAAEKDAGGISIAISPAPGPGMKGGSGPGGMKGPQGGRPPGRPPGKGPPRPGTKKGR